MKKTKNKKGFTLIELIIVIAVLAILAAILVPSMTGYLNEAHSAVCTQNAQELSRLFQYRLSLELADGGFEGTNAARLAVLSKEITANYGDRITESGNKFKGFCPQGGEYTISFSADGAMQCYCSIHGNIFGGFDPEDVVKKMLAVQKLKDYFDKFRDPSNGIDSEAAGDNLEGATAAVIKALKEQYGIDFSGVSWRLERTKNTTDTGYVFYLADENIKNKDNNSQVGVVKYTFDHDGKLVKSEKGSMKVAGNKDNTYKILNRATFRTDQ